ncbi:hypothetical protein [Embleya sp. NBC_00896]|uniref:hypothetical protein n=1 Tax=Embleya sp. NBC_00896 TaxID=2975961 RepID=UPI002F910C71|nr:hypothetical protein OG928_34525 [Embleya sp. NBC_00896]
MTTTVNGGTRVRKAWSTAVRVVAVVALWVWCVVSGWVVMFGSAMSTANCDFEEGFQCDSGWFTPLALWLPVLGALIAGGVGTWGALSRGRHWPWWFAGVALSLIPAIVMTALIDT